MNNEYLEAIAENYDIFPSEKTPYGKRSMLLNCGGNGYFFKISDLTLNEKYHYLANKGVQNIIYPLKNKEQEYLTLSNQQYFYISKLVENNRLPDNDRGIELYREINRLHHSTNIKRQLSPNKARPRFEEVSKQLDYQFKVLEQFVQSVEVEPINQFSMAVLGNYHHFLDAKKELIRLQKKLITQIKDREGVNYTFVHNNPKLSHLLANRCQYLLTSFEHSRMGISSLDMAKYYLENHHLDIDMKGILVDYYYDENQDFYYDYFRFLILYIIVKRINIQTFDQASAHNFEYNAGLIQKYFQDFSDLNKQDQITKANNTNN